VPTQQEIEELQRFYQVQKGVKPQEFPPHYPTSCLLGCVDVEAVLPQEEYRSLQKMCCVRGAHVLFGIFWNTRSRSFFVLKNVLASHFNAKTLNTVRKLGSLSKEES
jgi:hypothetical protein